MAKNRSPRKQKQVDYYKVIPEVRRLMEEEKGMSFTVFFRNRGESGGVERDYPNLKEGKGAPEKVVKLLFEWLKDPKYTFENAAVCVAPPYNPKREGDWLSWDAIAERIARPFRSTDEMYLDNPDEEIPKIVKAWYKSLGHLINPKASESEALTIGENSRGMTVEAISAWMLALYEYSERTIMYAVHEGKRVSAMIIFPVTSEVYEKMSTGKMRPEEIRPADLSTPKESGYLWIEALTPIEDGFKLTVAERSVADTHTFMYQMAYFCREMRPLRPVAFAVAVNELYDQRLESHGFSLSGHKMKGTDFPVRVMQRGVGLSGVLNFRYGKMGLVLSQYRRFNMKIWRKEDTQENQ